MKPYQNAVIIAGGKSSRMGTDKALLPFLQEQSLAQYQYKKLKKLFNYVALSTKKDKFTFDCPLILDITQKSSPLVALLSIFETHKTMDEVFILSVDAPFIDEIIIHTLMQKAQKLNKKNETFDVLVAKNKKGIEPLCALYKRSILPHIHACYLEDNHKLKSLLGQAITKTVYFSTLNSFTNLNYPHEYLQASKRKTI